MAFQIQKISDVGTSHPVVARLGHQTVELIKWLDLPKEKVEQIAALYAMTLTQRLLRCDQARVAIDTKLGSDIERVCENMRKDPHSHEVPYVVGLDGHAEDFLYDAKNFLRDLLSLFKIAFDCPLRDGSAFGDLKGKDASDLVQWCAKKMGADDKLTQLLHKDQDWITELVRKRNAVEHPEGKSGSLVIHNIRIAGIRMQLVPPCWHRTDQQETNLLTDMQVLVENLLTLAEDILADLVLRTCRFKQIVVYEIPLEARDPRSPIRLRLDLSPEILATLPTSKAAPRESA